MEVGSAEDHRLCLPIAGNALSKTVSYVGFELFSSGQGEEIVLPHPHTPDPDSDLGSVCVDGLPKRCYFFSAKFIWRPRPRKRLQSRRGSPSVDWWTIQN